jgi:hypothetical protein
MKLLCRQARSRLLRRRFTPACACARGHKKIVTIGVKLGHALYTAYGIFAVGTYLL